MNGHQYVNIRERQQINRYVRQMLLRHQEYMKVFHVYEDLQELKTELFLLLGPFLPYLNYYLIFLEWESLKCNPEQAFCAGKRDRQNGVSLQDGVHQFLHNLEMSDEIADLERGMEQLYRILYQLLQGAKGLIQDLTEAYRAVYGKIIQNITAFYEMGYQWESKQ